MNASIALSELREVDVDGPVRYREWDGPSATTFVCVHGLGGSHANWASVAPGLAERGRVVAVDLPGFGLTPLAGRSARMRPTESLLAAFLREVAPRDAGSRIVYVGNSMGGAYGLLLGALHPGLVDAMVLTCPALPWARGGWPAPIVAGAFAIYGAPGAGEWFAGQRFRRLSARKAVEIGFKITTANPERIDPAIFDLHVDVVQERRRDPEAIEAFVQAARSLIALGRRPVIAHGVLDRAPGPILIAHGARDRLVPVAWARAAAVAHPSWQLRVFPDLGHVPMLEDPARWLEAVGTWLDDVAPAGSVA